MEFAIAVFDLNNLKDINDRLGHEVGDQYIKNACRVICDSFKHSPVFRVGGDEFAVFLENTDYWVRERIMQQFDSRMEENAASGGVVVAGGSQITSREKTLPVWMFLNARTNRCIYENEN